MHHSKDLDLEQQELVHRAGVRRSLVTESACRSDDAAIQWTSAKRTDGSGSVSLLARDRADPTTDGAGVLVTRTQRDERDEEDTEPANVLGDVVRTLMSAVLAYHRDRAQELRTTRQPEDDQHPARLRDDARGAPRATECSWTRFGVPMDDVL